MSDPRTEISIRARFDRAPAGVRGALILRGEDADPHLVRFRAVRAVALDGADAREVPMPTPVLDVAPHRDVFVPFEIMTGTLAPGWYRFDCEVEVDGSARSLDGGKRFVVAWPRGTLRRGSVRLDRVLPLDAGEIRLDQVDSLADTTRIPFGAAPDLDVPTPELRVDGGALPLIDVERDATGRGRIVAYPIGRDAVALQVSLGSHLVEVPLA